MHLGMSESSIVSIIGALFVLLGGAGFWGFLQNRKEAPIKKRDADVAAAHVSQQMALAVADDLRTDVGRLREDLNHEREERKREVRELRQTVELQNDTIASLRRAVRAFRDAWAEITANWADIRLRDTPPVAPYIQLTEESHHG